MGECSTPVLRTLLWLPTATPITVFDDDLIAYQGTTAAPEWDEVSHHARGMSGQLEKADAYGFTL